MVKKKKKKKKIACAFTFLTYKGPVVFAQKRLYDNVMDGANIPSYVVMVSYS